MADATVHATFDGEVLRLEEPLQLPPNTRVRVTIELAAPPTRPEGRRSFLQTARALELEGPPDWSSRLEDYLYSPEVSSEDA